MNNNTISEDGLSVPMLTEAVEAIAQKLVEDAGDEALPANAYC
ncbi:MAG: hypothetical protein ACE5GV_15910 [Candidatus Scalindua sp.]